MARITVEDCSHQIPNLFELVIVAAKRARKLANGADPAEVMAQLARGLTNKLLHAPSVQMKKMSAEGRIDALALAPYCCVTHVHLPSVLVIFLIHLLMLV